MVSPSQHKFEDVPDSTALLSFPEVIRDKKTGESLQYAFIEFDKQEDVSFHPIRHTRQHADEV